MTSLRAFLRVRGDQALLGAAALALVACFFNPGLTIKRSRFDEVIVIDITQSMSVTDVLLEGKPVSRLDFAKHALRQTLLDLPCGSKVGWAVFTEYRSFLLLAPVEVCANLNELRSTLAHIDNRMAWAGNSEVSKAIHSGIGIVSALPEKPSLVFITDGQEAPPLNPRYRPSFDDKPGETPGLLVGVGDLKPSPIPKTDAIGRPLGFWKADEVMQVDPRSKGRGGSVGDEKLSDDGAGKAVGGLGATPGLEHFSELREAYLRLLAQERGFQFHRLQSADGLSEAMRADALARPARVRSDGRVALAALAFCLILAHSVGPLLLGRWWRKG